LPALKLGEYFHAPISGLEQMSDSRLLIEAEVSF